MLVVLPNESCVMFWVTRCKYNSMLENDQTMQKTSPAIHFGMIKYIRVLMAAPVVVASTVSSEPDSTECSSLNMIVCDLEKQ